MLSSLSILAASLLSFCTYVLFTRLHSSPLAKYPGPRLAAASTIYKMYYDLFQGGGWADRVHELHAIYGPIVRVGPNEISFGEPNAYGDVYASGNSLSKDSAFYGSFAIDDSTFTTADTHEALRRRQPMSPFFSRRAILRLESVIQSHVDKLICRLTDESTRQPAHMHRAFRSATLDVISAYCFASCPHALDTPNFEHESITSLESESAYIWWFKHFPLIRKLLLSIPYWAAIRIKPKLKGILAHRIQMIAQIEKVISEPMLLADAEHRTVYEGLLAHHRQLGHDRLVKTLHDEGVLLRFAGSDTVAVTLSVTTAYLLRDDERRHRLISELKVAWPDKGSHQGCQTLEKLPYLTAVIKEGLRMSFAVPSPLPRVVGSQGLRVSGVSVPPGTIVSAGITLVHFNPHIFPEPSKFIPERWLDPQSSLKLDKFLVAFSRGPRACLGINLAYCELYLTLGHLFRKVNLREDETQLANLHPKDYFVPIFQGNQLHAYAKCLDS